ncbi:hypothetical protein Tco_1581545, partial [Tanacetum coccineum]
MVDVASSSGTNIVTSNPFDVLNMVEKDTPAAPRDSVNSIGDDLNVGNSIVVNLDNEDNDSENDVEEDENETTSFVASKSCKGTGSFKSKGGTGKKSLYEHWKDGYDDPYDDDEEHEDLMDESLWSNL